MSKKLGVAFLNVLSIYTDIYCLCSTGFGRQIYASKMVSYDIHQQEFCLSMSAGAGPQIDLLCYFVRFFLLSPIILVLRRSNRHKSFPLNTSETYCDTFTKLDTVLTALRLLEN